MHKAMFISINLLFFVIWLVHPIIPWFIWTFFITSIPLVIHYSWFHYPKNRLILHIHIFGAFQCLFFFTWAIIGRFPWFIFPFGIWGAILVVHAIYFRRSNQIKDTQLPIDEEGENTVESDTTGEGQTKNLYPQPTFTIDIETTNPQKDLSLLYPKTQDPNNN